ncbi:class I SAM-dependent DNA methyltransferase [Arthrobacter sp. NPDC058130]|uniref:HsdM family class I SAM-dependent methyltransferase n=1 Tax=Arthrobacter sp. NPDC058130 TaxID=3346353 RepID=UPI0036EE0687
MPADEFFVESLRASLVRPVVDIRDAISTRIEADTEFRQSLIKWMVDEQGWPHDRDRFDEEIARVAQVATYVFATRLLFYTALRRAQPALPALSLPADGHPSISQAVVRSTFDTAREVTGDYETVFSFDDICRYALISNLACKGWIKVIDLLDHFRLEEIGYDVLGKLFERLIDPHERYEWGQHYTNPDVVDLMLSLAVPDGRGVVLDPACGGGTFLVRTYARKKLFHPGQSHAQRLREIAGSDISAFAASVATIGLASQNLESGANYPQVREASFFRLAPGKEFISLPDGAGGRELRTLDQIDAVVCNPPYIRYDMIGEARRFEADAVYKDGHRGLPPLRNRFNYHLYFWFHSANFLAPGGRMLFITSGEWLDSDYGGQLQEWLLNKFSIEAVVESMAEQWFSEARVGTVVLSLRKLHKDEDRRQLKTRFVTLRAPLRELFGHSAIENTREHFECVDALRDRILGLEGSGESSELDHAVIRQEELRALGMDADGRYSQVTWRSRFLRAPKLALRLAERSDFVPVGDIGKVRLGLKTGADSFFFMQVLKGGTAANPLVGGMTGWSGRINRDDLLPALQNPRDLDIPDGRRFRPKTANVQNRYLYPREHSRGAGLRAYIRHGENQRVHEKALVRQNATTGAWYRQTREIVRSRWVLPYNSAYDYFAVDNEAGAVLNGRFVGVDGFEGTDVDLLGAVLNSTFAIMTRLLVGTSTGNEGAFDLGPPAVRLIMVPDPRRMTDPTKNEEVRTALDAIRSTDRVPPAPSSTGAVDPARRRLDYAILVALGISPGDAAVLLDEVYESYGRWRAAVEAVEDQVQANRRALGKRGGQRSVDPASRAARDVLAEIADSYSAGFLELVQSPIELIDAVAPPEDDQQALLPLTVVKTTDGEILDLAHTSRVSLLRLFRTLRWAGPVPLPLDGSRCLRFIENFHVVAGAVFEDAKRRARYYLGEDLSESVAVAVQASWVSQELAKLRSPEDMGPVDFSPAQMTSSPSLFDTDGLVPPAPIPS